MIYFYYALSFLVGIGFGAYIVAKWIDTGMAQIETHQISQEIPQRARAYTKSTKLKPKVNNDEKAVERESAFSSN